MKSSGQIRRVREFRIVEALIYRYGPAVRRVPRMLRRRAIRQASIPRLAGVRTWRFGDREWVSPCQARVVGGEVNLSRLALRGHRLPAPFVAELSDSWLVGRHAAPFTASGQMLLTSFRNTVGVLSGEHHSELERWVSGDRGAMQAPEALVSALGQRPVCSLVGRFDTNYFHWLVDACSQLEGIHIYRERTGLEPVIVIRSPAPAFVRDSVAVLGVDAASVVEWPVSWAHGVPRDDRDLIAVPIPELVVSAWRHYRHGSSGESLAWLRAAFLRGALGDRALPSASDFSEECAVRVYIQRPSAGWRTIENENTVRACLLEMGFKVVRPGELSLVEQIRLFSRASVIVGMHGAGLTNILFAPHAELVELAGSYGGPEYLSMCCGLGNRYTRFQCEGRGEDIRVDLALLRSTVAAAVSCRG